MLRGVGISWAVPLALFSVGGCRGLGPPSALGYEYWPLAKGTLTLTDASGNVVQELTVASSHTDMDSDCEAERVGVNVSFGAWDNGNEPVVNCEGDGPPYASFYTREVPPSDHWPHRSGAYAGRFALGGGTADVNYHIEIEEQRGTLTPIPQNWEVQGLEPTSEDYYRRYRITGEIDCAEGDLPCEGTWKVDVVYEETQDSVSWLYAVEE
jgi:hypothetical protein